MRKGSKYGSRPTVVDGHRFMSRKEARRYGVLKLLEAAGEIVGLQLQPRFPCVVGTTLVCTYVADFKYLDKTTGAFVIEDCKGFRTQLYKLKKRLVEAIHGITIVET